MDSFDSDISQMQKSSDLLAFVGAWSNEDADFMGRGLEEMGSISSKSANILRKKILTS
jgi:hypothetical protein